MNRWRRNLVLVGFFSIALLPQQARAQAQRDVPVSAVIDIKHADLTVSPVAANWPSYNGDYTGRRFTSLTQITPSNVESLRAQWAFHVPHSDSLEVTPVVVNGVMFVTAANDAYAVDARTGRTIWHYSRPITQGLIDDASRHINRGVGVWGSRVYMNTDNAHLLCLDARSGNLLWDVAYADWNKNYGATSAPLVINGKVLVGTSGGDDGVRGFVAAYDAATGKLVWRFWTIPGPGEPGSESWPGDSYLHAGGTTWMPGTYDPELNTVYWGVSNASPDFNGEGRPGDDLYTCSVLALDPDTGKLKWHFQFTPHDLYDYDATETASPGRRGIQRQTAKASHRSESQRLYLCPRSHHRRISFRNPLRRKTQLDQRHRRKRPPDHRQGQRSPHAGRFTKFARAFLAPQIGSRPLSIQKRALSFSCRRKNALFFSPARKHSKKAKPTTPPVPAVRPANTATRFFWLLIWTQRHFAWRYLQANSGRWSAAGTMTTATGLVFFGDNSESFEAVDAKTGKPLWHFNTGQPIHASPMSLRGERQTVCCHRRGKQRF